MRSSDVLLVLGGACTSVFVTAYMFFTKIKGSPKKRSYPGILNLGNTCFLNSLLQALSPCASIIQCFETMLKNGHNLRNSLSFNLYSAFKVLNNESLEQNDQYNPRDILDTLYAKGWTIPAGEQDAYELFHVLMETLNEEKPEDAKVISLFDGTSLMQHSWLIGSEGVNKYRTDLPKAPSKILHLPFQGKIANQLICMRCTHRFPVKYDSFDSLSISLGSSNYMKGIVSLESLLKQYVTSENIEGMLCESCNTRGDFLKKMMLGKLPSTLCVHIQRTSWTAYGAIKRNDKVLFPDYLDMSNYTTSQPRISNLLPVLSLVKDGGKLSVGASDYVPKLEKKRSEGKRKNFGKLAQLPYSTPINMLKALNFYNHVAVSGFHNASKLPSIKNEENGVHSELESLVRAYRKDTLCDRTNKMYRLMSVIVHLGDVTSGHFVTYKRSTSRFGIRFPNKWIFASDTTVRPASSQEVFSADAYMLLYEKL